MLKRIKKDSNKLNLHLGCGEKFIEGHIHIDLNNFSHIDYKSNVDNLSMFEDNSVDSIYCSHTLEYFNQEDAKKVLSEWYRVLKKKGILRVAVPNFTSIIDVYLKTKDINSRGVLGPLYGKWKSDDGNHFYHKTVYDLKSLTDLLEETGFNNIKKFEPTEVFGEKFDDYSLAYIPHKDKEGILISLNLEGEK